MTEATIEVRDETFNAEDALEAVEQAADEDGNVQTEAVQVGDTIVHGDGCRDEDVYIADIGRGVSVGLTKVSHITERAEEAIPMPFEEYLTEEVFTDGGYTFEDTHRADIKVSEWSDGSGYFMPEDFERAVEDSGVELHTISDGWLCLNDSR